MIRWVHFLRTDNKERLKNKAEKIIGSRILHIFRIFFSFSTFSSFSFLIFFLVFYFILLFLSFSQEWRGKAWSWLPTESWASSKELAPWTWKRLWLQRAGPGSRAGSWDLKAQNLGAEQLPKSQRAPALQPCRLLHIMEDDFSSTKMNLNNSW